MIGKMKNPNNMSVFQVQTVAKGRVGGTSVAPSTAQQKPTLYKGGMNKEACNSMYKK